jgi:hypothetical protein
MEYIRHCIKCGEGVYDGGSDKIRITWIPNQEPKKLKNGVQITGAISEYLGCRCKTCGFEWSSITLEQHMQREEVEFDESLASGTCKRKTD